MTHKLHYTTNYIVVLSDDDIKSGDYISDGKTIQISFDGDHCKFKKIIAHMPINGYSHLNGVDVLPELDVLVDMQQALREYVDRKHIQAEVHGFIDGYETAMEKYKFTEEDMIEAYKYGKSIGGLDMKDDFDGLLNSLQQPKMPIEFECEMEQLNNKPGASYETITRYKPKTITTDENLTQWIGKYIYEGGGL